MTLDVFLHDRRVGTLAQEPSTRVVSFTLDEGYFTERARPVLGQMFEDRRERQQFRQSKLAGQLPAFFANLMPEGALKEIIEAQTPDQGPLALLARIGVDLPGAVVVRPGARESHAVSERRVFDEPARSPADAVEGWRFSLAGVQFKMSAVRDPEARFTLPFTREGGRWILKFGSPDYPALPEDRKLLLRRVLTTLFLRHDLTPCRVRYAATRPSGSGWCRTPDRRVMTTREATKEPHPMRRRAVITTCARRSQARRKDTPSAHRS